MSHRTRGLFLVLLLASAGCGGTAALQSLMPSETPSLDGQIDEWAGQLTVLKKGGDRTSLGLMNDNDHLYLALVTRDPRLAGQILVSGLEVWVDREGGKKKQFGVRFPVGQEEAGRGRPGSMIDDTPRDQEARAERLRAMQSELEILGEDGEAIRLPVEAAPGIEVHAAMAYGELTMELRFPLQSAATSPYAIGARPGDVIGVGLRTRSFGRNAEGPEGGRPEGSMGGGGRPGGGMRGGGMGGGGNGGSMGGRQGGRPMSPPQPLDAWVSVTLSDPGAPDAKN